MGRSSRERIGKKRGVRDEQVYIGDHVWVGAMVRSPEQVDHVK